jgi:peptidoglycan/LPS O-acetylase OafA/YrhL
VKQPHFNVNNLDVLRAVAVLCVIVAHLLRHVLGIEGVWGVTVDELGRFGVLVFFVHTSLVLMMSLDRTKSSRPTLDFYIRRVFRIYPLSVFVVLLVVILRIPSMPDHLYKSADTNHIIQNLLLVQNVTGHYSVIGPLWTLPYEIQMYLALPLLYVALKRSPPAAVFVVWFLAIMARIITLAFIGWNLTAIRFVPCFVGGVFAYPARKTHQAFLPGYGWPAALVSIFALYAWIHEAGETPVLDYIMCLALGAALACFKDMRTTRFTEICGVVAKYSYGSYLFHVPVMWISFFVIAAPYLQWPAFVGLSLAIPWAAYRWIEEPMITLGRQLASRVSESEGMPLKSAAAA